MANKLRGDVTLDVGHEVWVHRPTFTAIVKIEERLGGVIGVARRAANGEFGVNDVAVILWATFLSNTGKSPSLEDVGEVVIRLGMAKASPVVRQILTNILTGDADSGENASSGK